MNLKNPKLDSLIRLLSDGEWLEANELAITVGHRFGSAIHDARNKGYLIEAERVGRQYNYRMIKSCTKQQPKTLADLISKLPQILEQVPYLKLLVLFGSRARGDDSEGSDWDFAFLCDEEQRKQYETDALDFLKIGGILQKIYRLGDDEIDAVDMRMCSDVLAHNIAKDGQVLYEAESGEFKYFQQQKLMSKEQIQALRAQQQAKLQAVLKELRQ